MSVERKFLSTATTHAPGREGTPNGSRPGVDGRDDRGSTPVGRGPTPSGAVRASSTARVETGAGATGDAGVEGRVPTAGPSGARRATAAGAPPRHDSTGSTVASSTSSRNRLTIRSSARCSVSLHVDFASPTASARSVSEHCRGVS